MEISNLNVALFSTNLKKIQRLSTALRRVGIFAAFYQDAPALINHMNNNQCHLVIADYDVLDQVHRLFDIHPKIENGETLVGVYSQDKDFKFSERFWSASNYRPVSLFKDSSSLVDQIGSTLHWVHVVAINQARTIEMKTELKSIKGRFENHLGATDRSNRSYQQLRNVSAIVRGISSQSIRDKESYLLAVSKMLERWEGVQSYAFYTMNSTNQKLIPLDLMSKKYKNLPTLRMGKDCNNGIEKFAQEMAYQVAFDEMGMRTVALRIEGSMKKPEILCFLSFTEKEFAKVDDQYHWNLFETLLSNVYRRMILQTMEEEIESQFLPVWDFLSFLDEENQDDQDYRFINIDLNQLNHFISKNPQRRFFWKSFFNDLLIELSKKLDSQSKISTFGTTGVMVALLEENMEKQVHAVKEFFANFEYWSYFAESKLVIPQYIYPEAYLIPSSSSYYLRNKEAQVAKVNQAHRPHETSIRS